MYGTGAFQFAVAVILAIIVCHDTMGVRREAGKQAVVIKEICKSCKNISENELAEIKLKEFLGHTPILVLVGILLGICNAFIMYNVLM